MTAPEVFGETVDDQTRCVHYNTAADVVAIRFYCCDRFYPCHLCHADAADHAARQWPVGLWAERAILCGVCRSTLSITGYRTATQCPHCTAPFNDGCRAHAHLYFEVPSP
ncbi:hypothetical protein KIV56_08655 [Cryobacterium breve]|uniref:CHY-type domain-containing protein n=1 Tax=Cryobacterium breve TaxID=1259258 RepID=A0ABY7NGX9_9MICO|nr:CHY zinc finger protein [Cryobacterium breve]WBM81237.1 hypothetical protein KIV56_08655 [Cryobacterium breve]